MLQPTNQWQWQVDCQKRLLLDIDPSMAFTTAFITKQLTMEVLNDTSFSLDDAFYYQELMNKLQQLDFWTIPQMVQIALNATAAHRYYKPMMPKSWFFKTNDVAIHLGQVTKAQLNFMLYTNHGYAEFLTIEQTGNAVVCMLLDDVLQLNDDKTMEQFDVIKVMNDRLFESQQVRQLKTA